MKYFVLLLVCVAFLAVESAPSDESKGKYTDEFDDLDVEEILKKKRLFNHYLECARSGKGCTPQGLQVRERIQEVLETGCERCTDTQKRKGRVVADFVLEHHPDIFLEFEKKYDPTGKYRAKYAAQLEKEGIVLPKTN